MENTREISIAKKVYALREANPNITNQTACILLGVTQEELDKSRIKEGGNYGNPFEIFGDIFGKKQESEG